MCLRLSLISKTEENAIFDPERRMLQARKFPVRGSLRSLLERRRRSGTLALKPTRRVSVFVS